MERLKKTVIIDYGLGNLRSVIKGLEKAGSTVSVTSDAGEIAAADGIVLPGVGAFREGMEMLGGLKDVVIDSAESGVPILGICLGMQMLLESSEEHGMSSGIGLVPGTVKEFPMTKGFKVPHMGWNSIEIQQDSVLFEGVADHSYVYFVHSFYASTPPEYMLTSTDYITEFASSVGKGSVFGVQFHPEKSGTIGLKILENFISII